MKTNITGISGSRIAYYAAKEIVKNNKTLIIVSRANVAERLRDDISFFVHDRAIYVMPEEDDLQIIYEAKDSNMLVQRIQAVDSLVSDDKTVVIAPVSAALRPLQPVERFMESVIELEMGVRVEPAELRQKLVSIGYSPAPVVEAPGEFSARGGIIDIYSPNNSDPVRIEFFDDEIDSLRFFDPKSQLSFENIDFVRVCPAAEFLPTAYERRRALSRITDEYDERLSRLKAESGEGKLSDGRIDRIEELKGRISEMFENCTNVQIFANYLKYFDVTDERIWDYVIDPADANMMIYDPNRVAAEIPEYQEQGDINKFYDKDIIAFTPFPEPIKGIDVFDKVVNVPSRQIASFNGQMELFGREMRRLSKEGVEVHIVSADKERHDRIREYLEDARIFGHFRYDLGLLGSGMMLDDEKLCYITDTDIFPNIRKSSKKRLRHRSGKQDFLDLHAGDYVVHEEHGIGRFEGIKTLEADGEIKDYLKIHYSGTDVLYIPTEQMDIVQRYIGSEGKAPKLSSLSGGDWRNTRARARKAIEEIAEDLVKLYAEREMKGGYAFQHDTVWQREFEDSFLYQETDDQLQAIEEIKADMEKPLPMDRLLCGDVGYGKTEVAARAIFKCVAEGKQAVFLAPTTLLANQHYNTLKERFQDYPFNIEMLSRFVDETRQKRVLNDIAKGNVDLVIGTHRLLSDDVAYKDLGLLVIDEEQRFGVKHKEKLKMARQTIDVLTLSATPIPRTLNMSLTGIKNISTIEEPPGDRYPVQTFVSAPDDELIRGAIERELARGGQLYVIYNRVNGINDIAKHINKLVPEATVAVGHGRMNENTLENVMLDFVEGDVDIFVTTTIIENGIDIPNANTIIILNSDKLGLSQLYQLRGRVGRSNRLAYAYLLYKPERVLTEVATKRLAAIREFTEFGAGFKLAMRDLELRGAGNVLGEAQHGNIAGIGYELYVKEIDKAVRRLKGEKITESREEISIEVDISARIPSEYIKDETLKLQAYKKIAQITSHEEAEELIAELIDRYGDLPDVTIDLVRIAEIKCLAAELGVKNISERGGRFVVEFNEDNNADAFTLVVAKQKFGEGLIISSGSNPYLSLQKTKEKPAARILDLMTVMKGARLQGLAHSEMSN